MRAGIVVVVVAAALAFVGAAAGGQARTVAPCKAHHVCTKHKAKHAKHKAKPKPKPKPKAPAPPAPTLPWQAGSYSGTTSQQAPIVLQLGVAGGTASVSATDWLGESCGSAGILTVHDALPAASVQHDGTFDIESDGVSLHGQFGSDGQVTGTIQGTSTVSNGSCSVAGITFTARYAGASVAAPPMPGDGRYAGLTSQNEQILIDVSGPYVSDVTWNADMDCSDPSLIAWYDNAQLVGTWILGNTFVDTYSWTASDGSNSTITVAGTFDANGGASGTLKVDTTGSGASCTSGSVSWSAHHQ